MTLAVAEVELVVEGHHHSVRDLHRFFSRREGKGRDIARSPGRLPGKLGGAFLAGSMPGTRADLRPRRRRPSGGPARSWWPPGAGMGVDSGLPDFRGDQGFWKAYPGLRAARPLLRRRRQPRPLRGGPGLRLGLLRPPAPPLPGHRSPRRLPHPPVLDGASSGFPASPSPPTWTASSRRPASIRSGSTRSTGPSTTSSARRRAATSIWECREEVPVDLDDHARASSCPPAGTAGGWPAPTSSCSATGPGCRTGRSAQGAALRGLPRRSTARSGLVVLELGAGTAVATIRHGSPSGWGARPGSHGDPGEPARGRHPRAAPRDRGRSARGAPGDRPRPSRGVKINARGRCRRRAPIGLGFRPHRPFRRTSLLAELLALALAAADVAAPAPAAAAAAAAGRRSSRTRHEEGGRRRRLLRDQGEGPVPLARGRQRRGHQALGGGRRTRSPTPTSPPSRSGPPSGSGSPRSGTTSGSPPPRKHGKRYFYMRNSGLQPQSVLHVTDDPAVDGRVLLDPNAMSKDGTVALSGHGLLRRRAACSPTPSPTPAPTGRSGGCATSTPARTSPTRCAGPSSAAPPSPATARASTTPAIAAPAEAREAHRAQHEPRRSGTTPSARPRTTTCWSSSGPTSRSGIFGATVSDDGRWLVIGAQRGTNPERVVFVQDLVEARVRSPSRCSPRWMRPTTSST